MHYLTILSDYWGPDSEWAPLSKLLGEGGPPMIDDPARDASCLYSFNTKRRAQSFIIKRLTLR